MFEIAIEDFKLRDKGSFTYFLRYSEQTRDFKSEILAILEEKRKTDKKKVEVLIPGCAFGEEVVSWRWILETEIKPIVPDFDRFDFEFIGIEKNSDVYKKAKSNLKYGFDIFSTLDPPQATEQQLMERFDFMFHVNKKIKQYNKHIKIIFSDILSQKFRDILVTSDIVIMNHVMYQSDESQQKETAKQFKSALDANPLLRIMGEDAPALKKAIELLSAQEQIVQNAAARRSI
jgi:chemotaxis methyl-accepting protein methylase